MVAPHSSPLFSETPEVAQAKKQMRTHCLEALKQHDPLLDATLCARLAEYLLALPAQTLACVWPFAHEVDVRPLCHTLHQAGRRVLLPETPPKGQPLRFRVWAPHTTMLPGRFGTLVPEGAYAIPDAILVPLVGFDRKGNRLGYGGGYYDRTLAGLPGIPAIGYALSVQEVDHIPTGPYDKPLSCIVTEKERLHFD